MQWYQACDVIEDEDKGLHDLPNRTMEQVAEQVR